MSHKPATTLPPCLQVIRERKLMKQDLGDILGMMFGGEPPGRIAVGHPQTSAAAFGSKLGPVGGQPAPPLTSTA